MPARDELSGYLLGELSDADRAAFEADLRSDPELRVEVDRLRPVVGRLRSVPDDAWAPVAPPPLRLPDEAAGEPPARRRRNRRWSLPTLTLRPLVAGLAALLLLAAGAGGALLATSGSTDAPSTAVALAPVEPLGQGATGRVRLTSSSGVKDSEAAVVEVDGLRPTRADQYYELWLLNAADDLVSLGAFKVGADGSARVEVPVPVDPSRYRFVDVSLESDDGDPAHSTKSVLRAPTA